MNAIPDPKANAKPISDQAASGELSGFAKYSARSLKNLKVSFDKVTARFRNRPAHYAKIEWKTPLGIFVSLIFMAFALLDGPLGAFHNQWSIYMSISSEYVTLLGQGGWYLIPAAIMLAIANLTDWSAKSRRGLLVLYNRTTLAFFVVVSTGLSGLVSVILKYGIGRARPDFYQELGIFAFRPFSLYAYFAGFPSGHSTTVGSVAAILILFFPQSRIYIIPLAIWVAATRLVVGAHYPSDVVAGLGFGFASTVLAAMFFARLGYIFNQVPYGMPTVKPSARIFW